MIANIQAICDYMEELVSVENALIDDGQHCLFKHDDIIIDPDSGSIMAFEKNSFLEEHGSLTHNIIVAAVLIFDTADAALNWKRWEKQRRKAEQQAREQGRRKRIKRGLVL